jgi:hypothetical protein
MIIAKNITINNVFIDDLGLDIAPLEQRSLDNFTIAEVVNSDDLKQAIQDNKVILNNGVSDLSKEDSLSFAYGTLIGLSSGVIDVRINQAPGKRTYQRYLTDFTTASIDCNSDTYTLVKSYIFDASKFQLDSMLVKISNNHFLKIEIDDIIIFNESIDSFRTTMDDYFDKGNSTIIPCNIIEHQGFYMDLKLGSIYANSLKIYQKRRSGTGYLTIDGVIIVYKEDVIV